jgi:hypothetical protein
LVDTLALIIKTPQCDQSRSSRSPLTPSAVKKRRHGRRAVMITLRSPSAHVNYWRRLGNTCPKTGINCCSDQSAWQSADMRAHSTTVDPKCDILFLPDGVLGAGEAMRRREFIRLFGGTTVTWPLVGLCALASVHSRRES